jgi:hypothetical protein
MPFQFEPIRYRIPVLTAFSMLVSIIIIIGIMGSTGINEVLNISQNAKNRLIPAVITAEIAEELNQNRLYTEQHIATLSQQKGIYTYFAQSILTNHKQIDSLITRYNDEYGLQTTQNKLMHYQTYFVKYREVEKELLKLSQAGEKEKTEKLFLGQSLTLFQTLIDAIHTLTKEHIAEGEKNFLEAQQVANRMKFIFYTAIGIAFIVVIVIGTMVGFSYLNN